MGEGRAGYYGTPTFFSCAWYIYRPRAYRKILRTHYSPPDDILPPPPQPPSFLPPPRQLRDLRLPFGQVSNEVHRRDILHPNLLHLRRRGRSEHSPELHESRILLREGTAHARRRIDHLRRRHHPAGAAQYRVFQQEGAEELVEFRSDFGRRRRRPRGQLGRTGPGRRRRIARARHTPHVRDDERQAVARTDIRPAGVGEMGRLPPGDHGHRTPVPRSEHHGAPREQSAVQDGEGTSREQHARWHARGHARDIDPHLPIVARRTAVARRRDGPQHLARPRPVGLRLHHRQAEAHHRAAHDRPHHPRPHRRVRIVRRATGGAHSHTETGAYGAVPVPRNVVPAWERNVGKDQGDIQRFEEGLGGTVVGCPTQDHEPIHGNTDRVPRGDGVREGIADRGFVPRRHRATGAASVRVGGDGRREEGGE